MICGDTKNEKEEANKLQGARKLRKDQGLAWAPPRSMSKWPDWEESEAGTRGRSGSARDHCRVGCGKH